jgi:uncharacterized LabA/DUF88 family protein
VADEPDTKRVAAFIDGQNLFRSVKEAWGYHFPNYDVSKLTHAIAESKAMQGWNAPTVYFYTGTPDPVIDPMWATFWQRKVAAMRLAGVTVFTRTLRYGASRFTCGRCATEQVVSVSCANCGTVKPDRGREKGIDVRIALDIVRLAREDAYDVALVFSQDQDLSEAADEVRATARQNRRWISVASVYPDGVSNRRGINKTDWLSFDRSTYDACIDPRDYRGPAPS